MKRFLLPVLCLALGMLLISFSAIAGTLPGTGIKQTSHDLSSATGQGNLWGAGVAADPQLDRICIYCHAPHHTLKPEDAAAQGINYYPLWNHALSNLTYNMYQNTDPDNPEIPGSIQHQLNANLGQPGSVSKLCLSCHDGSVAISTYGYLPSGSRNTGSVKASGRIGIGLNGDLTNHHPIGFNYRDVAALDDEIRDPDTSQFLGANPYGLFIADVLWGDNMECSSCHDVHNTKNTGKKFVWVEDTNSNFCFSCHKK